MYLATAAWPYIAVAASVAYTYYLCTGQKEWKSVGDIWLFLACIMWSGPFTILLLYFVLPFALMFYLSLWLMP
jgi:hypothetical protein